MDFTEKWSNLPRGPSLRNLTEGSFGVLKEAQHAAVQDLTKAHIESFDQAVTDGLSRVVQVSLTRDKVRKPRHVDTLLFKRMLKLCVNGAFYEAEKLLKLQLVYKVKVYK